MEPINSNSSTTLIQPKTNAEKQGRDAAQAETQNQTQRAAEDRFSSSNPVSELQLQRSQVVESLGQSQQSDLDGVQTSGEAEFPAAANRDIQTEQQAAAATDALRQRISEQPGNALQAQADQASRDAALTLFQQS
ncbi:hypothetical protein [Ketobacter sp.]|uniref:hypothetical protein n=1 Tax=Ketobacter sp. TaxID=2083498 RepID=UPI000F1E061D|nr:hypothetical protein [Ketobacter sp.]RLT93782.1 MAG: hypothetical protein D9N14_17765 [Ketobacter sp.]